MHSRHDQLFKDLIRAFPADLLRLILPEAVRRLRLETLEFQPTEEFLDLPQGRERRLDLMARVSTWEGEPVLLHVEVETRFRAGMAERLWSYNRLVRLRRGQPVWTVVLYRRGGPPGLRAEVHRERWLRREICRFCYTSFGLSGASAESFLRRRNPLAWGFAAQMRWRTGSLAERRLACLRRIARARGLSEVQRFLLANVVQSYLQLNGRAAESFERLLGEPRHREVRTMIMTWADQKEAEGRRKGLEEGRQERRQEGHQQGIRDVVLHLLSRRFSPLPSAVARRVAAIASAEELTRLADRILDARSLDELGLA
jgi:predicted transposase YdaD